MLRLRSAGSTPLRQILPHGAPASLALAPAGARAGLPSSEPLSAFPVRRFARAGAPLPLPRARRIRSCGRVPLASVARLILTVCMPSPAPPPGCRRIAAGPNADNCVAFGMLPKSLDRGCRPFSAEKEPPAPFPGATNPAPCWAAAVRL